ncbi:hypothetical protein TWF102_005169 [Orbilia oligospora]|uniref:Uncharacterized protein n=1 Tax=Orbilia oligospora TaxID=2813651 RepID=A0A7C8JC00_ORBOL|nr:hypothetical protein TWF102_005169 [Orbilia oligospora]
MGKKNPVFSLRIRSPQITTGLRNVSQGALQLQGNRKQRRAERGLPSCVKRVSIGHIGLDNGFYHWLYLAPAHGRHISR